MGLFAHDKTVSFKDFKVNGLNFVTQKNEIIKVFGSPGRVFEPKYECGFCLKTNKGTNFIR